MKDDIGSKVLTDPRQVGHGRRLSTLLNQLSLADAGSPISVGEIVGVIGNRAFGALLFALAAPVALPIPIPGFSVIMGVPLLLLTCQLMIGRRQPWLPAAILRRSFARRGFSRIIARIVPWLERVERVIGPRHLWVTEPLGERIIGSLGFVLALTFFIPVPFGNMLPALGLALSALGLLERDGRVILAGAGIGAIGLLMLMGVAYGLAAGAALLDRVGLNL